MHFCSVSGALDQSSSPLLTRPIGSSLWNYIYLDASRLLQQYPLGQQYPTVPNNALPVYSYPCIADPRFLNFII